MPAPPVAQNSCIPASPTFETLALSTLAASGAVAAAAAASAASAEPVGIELASFDGLPAGRTRFATSAPTAFDAAEGAASRVSLGFANHESVEVLSSERYPARGHTRMIAASTYRFT